MSYHLDALRSMQRQPEIPHQQGETSYYYASVVNETSLVHPKESMYFMLMLAFSAGIYLLFGLGTLAALTHPGNMPFFLVYLFYFLLFLLFNFLSHGFLIGRIKANSVKISPNQFPDVYNMLVEICGKMDLRTIPDVYVMQAGGVLNAFATRFTGRNFVVIYADIFEMAYHEGQEAVQFVLCHELAHIKRGHTYTWKKIALLPARFIPFLEPAYSRACEYTCDRYGAAFYKNGISQGLLALTCGKNLYQKVNVDALLQDTAHGQGFWTWFAEIFASHPHLINRLKQSQQLF